MKRGPGFKMLEDDSGHYYLVPQFEESDFERWCRDMEKGRDSEFDFEGNRIDGPHKLIIYDWEEE